jgi:pectate lyase-like protein
MRRRQALEKLFAATGGWLSRGGGRAAAQRVESAQPADRETARVDDAVSVKGFGAAGDGVTDDTAAIQAAIGAASSQGVRVRSGGADPYTEADRLGGVVFFPVGRYMISRPLILPRSGAYVAHAITLQGANRNSTTIAARSGFPADRGLLEWEPVAKRVTNQRIVSLGLDVNNTGARCIWFQPTNKRDWAHVDAESLYGIHLGDLVLFGNNTTTRVLVKIEGRMDYSRIDNIVADCVRGSAPAHSTIVLQFDADLLGAPSWARLLDYPGFNFGTIDSVRQGMQGGYNTMIDGRVSHSTMSHIHHGVGALGGAPGVHLRNGGLLTMLEWDFEGVAEDPELWIDNCTEVYGLHLQVSPTERGAGCGIRVTNSSFVRIVGHGAAAGYASFSQFGGKLLSLDARSDHCRFESIGGQASFAKEIDWGSPGNVGNYIEYIDVTAENGRTVVDENDRSSGSLRVTAALMASTIAARSSATQSIHVPGAQVGAEVLVGPPRSTARGDNLAAAVFFSASVEQRDVVSVVIHNTGNDPIAVAAGQTISVRVFNP